MTPWERLDEQAAIHPEKILGPPQDGFAAVPTESHSTPDQSGDAPATADQPVAGPAAGGQQTSTASDPPAGGVDPVTSTAGAAAAAMRPRRRSPRQRTPVSVPADGAGHRVPDADPMSEPGAAAEVQPISGGSAHRALWGSDGAPPLAADADHTSTDIPPPPAPPAEDEGMAPPPVDTGRPAATVDPITDR
jgi:hypothetical protein